MPKQRYVEDYVCFNEANFPQIVEDDPMVYPTEYQCEFSKDKIMEAEVDEPKKYTSQEVRKMIKLIKN